MSSDTLDPIQSSLKRYRNCWVVKGAGLSSTHILTQLGFSAQRADVTYRRFKLLIFAAPAL